MYLKIHENLNSHNLIQNQPHPPFFTKLNVLNVDQNRLSSTYRVFILFIFLYNKKHFIACNVNKVSYKIWSHGNVTIDV